MAFEKDKTTVLIMVVILILALSSIIFIQYNRKNWKTEEGQKQEQTKTDNSQGQIQNDKIEAENLIKSFTKSYNSYSTGDFSNMESLYAMMDESLAKQEKQKIENLKKNLEQTKTPYQTVESEVTKYEELKYTENILIAEVTIEKLVSDGAFIIDANSDESPVIFVDKEGKETEQKTYNLNTKKTAEVFQVTTFKTTEGWRINQIEKISQ